MRLQEKSRQRRTEKEFLLAHGELPKVKNKKGAYGMLVLALRFIHTAAVSS